MRCRLIAILLLLAVAAHPANNTQHPYRSRYVKDTFGKRAAARTWASAGIQQLRDSPHEWGTGFKGFGKRVGSAFGQHVIKNSIQYPVAAIRHEELGYRPSGKKGLGPRLGDALSRTVLTPKTTPRKKTVAPGRIAGALGSGLIWGAWQPAAL